MENVKKKKKKVYIWVFVEWQQVFNKDRIESIIFALRLKTFVCESDSLLRFEASLAPTYSTLLLSNLLCFGLKMQKKTPKRHSGHLFT